MAVSGEFLQTEKGIKHLLVKNDKAGTGDSPNSFPDCQLITLYHLCIPLQNRPLSMGCKK